MNECIEVMKLGFGMPAFNNDEIIIPSFIAKGVLEEDAYDYSAIGCVETAVPGKWGYRCTGMSYMNSGMFMIVTVASGCSFIFMNIIGLGAYLLALSFIVALFCFIPLVGSSLAMLTVALVGFATSPTIGIATIIYFLIY